MKVGHTTLDSALDHGGHLSVRSCVFCIQILRPQAEATRSIYARVPTITRDPLLFVEVLSLTLDRHRHHLDPSEPRRHHELCVF